MNFLFILTDQQNRDALSCMGNPNLETPNLDRLAARGTLHRRCYSPNPVCGPYRGTLLTGQYTSTCGVRNNGNPLPTDRTTFAEAFNQAGYETCWIGKWHLGANGNQCVPTHLRGGFKQFVGYQCCNGFYENVSFFDEANTEYRHEAHRTEVATDYAEARLVRMADQGAPFMMVASYQSPHYPEQPSPQYDRMYRGRKIIRRPNCQDIDPYTPTLSPPSPKPFERDPDYRRYGEDLDEYIRLYNAMCTQIDANVGRLLDRLEALGLADDTVILFTSDHGDLQGSHGLKNKCLPHEESAGVPLITYVPGNPEGAISDELISGIDFMPTFLDLAGIKIPDTVQGVSHAAQFKGQTAPETKAIFSENFQSKDSWCMMVKGEWKLAAHYTDEGLVPMLMTNLTEDPYEMKNLATDEQFAQIRSELLGELKQWSTAQVVESN